MKSTFLHVTFIGLLLTLTIYVGCSPQGRDQNSQLATIHQTESLSFNDKQLLERVEQFASSDEPSSASAWQALQSQDRSKLINDLTRISDASAPDDRSRALIAFTLCNLGHEYASNRTIVVSAMSEKPPFANLFGDWTVSLVRRLTVQGDYDLLIPLFEASEWSDGAMSTELAHAYSQGVVADPENFLRLLSSRPEVTRNRVLKLLRFNSLAADENTKVTSYLKNVSPQSKLRPIAEEILRVLKD